VAGRKPGGACVFARPGSSVPDLLLCKGICFIVLVGKSKGDPFVKIVTAAEMREIDRASSARFALPSLTLMENAGTAVADFVVSRYPFAKRIAVVCGKGNNGGDGFVAARKLHDTGKDVSVILLTKPSELQGDAAAMFAKLPVQAVSIVAPEDFERESVRAAFGCELLLDAVLGTGFRPPMSGLYAKAIEAMNAQPAPVIAVDIPSGADADAVELQNGLIAQTDAIVTFTAPRPAHVFSGLTAGMTAVAPIGSPEEAIVSSLKLNLITPRDLAALVQQRPAEANKGSYGHVLVIGGSLGKAGAAAMAGMAALRAGAGLSTVAIARSSLTTAASFHPEVMTEPLSETEQGTIALTDLNSGRLDEIVKGKTVLAVGPGISRNPASAQFVREVVQKYRVPIVLDADGLNAFDGKTEDLSGADRTLVITPHPGEMSRLTELTIADVQKDRIGVARSFAEKHQLIVVLKGHRTVVAFPDGDVWVNPTGNPGMATGGTGDVLTGMTAGLIAQNSQSIAKAVIGAVYLHGLAGDVACEHMGEQSLVATDLIHSLPRAFERVRNSAGHPQVEWGERPEPDRSIVDQATEASRPKTES
jgi:ADP-dependent NAD(P)H-hydrate dehydratase / NAD(P)H-hydrate epimerase